MVVDCNSVRIFANSSTREQSNKRSGTRLKTESQTGERRYGRVRLARFARVRLLRHALPISLLILRKKPTVLQSTVVETFGWVSVKRGVGFGLGLGLGSLKRERPRPRPRPRVFLTPVTRWVQGTLGLRGCLQLGNSIITCSVLYTYSAYIFIKPQPFIIETAAQIVSLVLTN